MHRRSNRATLPHTQAYFGTFNEKNPNPVHSLCIYNDGGIHEHLGNREGNQSSARSS
jgi:hypothetical protein